MSIFLSVLVMLCTAQTCKKDKESKNGHLGIEIINNSTKTINYNFAWNYPDTLIGEYNPYKDGTGGIKPNSSRLHPFSSHGKGCVEEYFKDGKKEWIYIFDQDTISKLDWNTVRQTNRGLLERRLIDLNYLQQHDFKITYP
ncbi:MAG: hypothetical protein KatS3mg028_1480 [Bacteroidia bacterium]|nr:MAG: hypothetical protein KatS3mg028_1480 [Bacteroidia bacterium]GIV44921.1 MAG: hypothetical protein KatS3mg035_2044 [Bacteroidia bacterium]